VPLGAIALTILITGLPSRPIARRRFDLFGFAMVAIALSSIQLLLDRGNHVDWFDAAETWIYVGIALSASWVGVVHLATSAQPLFNRQLFANRNFVVALFFMVVVGLVMFATMALLPPMLQRLFNYSVMDTGMALMPRGVGTLISMQVAGLLIRRGVDGRVLIGAGFALAGYSLWEMAGWSLAVDNTHVISSGFLQGLGMGFVFIPLNSSAFATLPPLLRTDGSSLLNLMRSIGASVGISIVTALLGQNLQRSHADLASHVTASVTDAIDFSTMDRFQSLGDALLRLIDGEVNRQAAMIAYIDDFYLMAWLSIAAIPLVVLMRRPEPK
jgi:MFS transporter, DHA2 family, multidrug resistance protein